MAIAARPHTNNSTFRAVLVAALGAFLCLVWFGSSAVASEISVATIVTDSARHQIGVEVADSPEERSTGLMHRQSMPADMGMLFDFQQSRMVGMWMRNTFIPLDMIFISTEGTVVRIAKDTVPHSEKTISSGQPVRYVLELNAGISDRIGLRTGHKVVHPIIDAAN